MSVVFYTQRILQPTKRRRTIRAHSERGLWGSDNRALSKVLWEVPSDEKVTPTDRVREGPSKSKALAQRAGQMLIESLALTGTQISALSTLHFER